ncbi:MULTISPECIES: cell division protein ZipA C-terminal FtsZ-binding domain-containing protein [unclassified Oceanobacter]|uniref:cell division protein ZipA C-terminal FtsZ-binding domain-containing protein n=2 Tax=Gammaproteobacteria TaxID=1236 RepID=UPI002734AEC9|nr:MULTISPECIES: cell division protein ZipA C-terminal FtsZ-binding domain-containing protein [unclassified Oceanobacter]MDP2607468.1 cell division protein ZipA C-terminal FtsZ-binding domain-containing protein [Oceanobacter sp. 1_MG-2023]MDP2610736.1 cell division protein ZipA C-terminal FtsZ-binding domain-containing protein [Oceanobacter sp. 2_MG-2023]
MELTWKTVMILLGLLAVVTIVVDGIRRMKRARAMALKLDINKNFKFPQDNHNPELPGGRFRVVEDSESEGDPITASDSGSTDNPGDIDAFVPEAWASDRDDLAAPCTDVLEPETGSTEEQGLQDNIESWLNARSQEIDQSTEEQPPAAIIPKAQPVNLDESVPLLMTVEALGEQEVIIEPEARTEEQSAISTGYETSHEEADTTLADSQAEDDQQPHLEDEIALQEEQGADQGSELIIYAGENAEQLSSRAAAEVVLVVHARARDEAGFSGLALLHLFDGCDLRYGEEKIFHRFEEADGQGAIQFSIAQTYEPGIFDPATMADENFAGLTFFLSLPGAKRPLEAYQAMSEMARLLADHLNAELKDGTLSTFTKQTVEHDRQQILEYERRQALLAKKQAAAGRRR